MSEKESLKKDVLTNSTITILKSSLNSNTVRLLGDSFLLILLVLKLSFSIKTTSEIL